MKIGIITCFDMKNVNYGNRLQTYALNSYLNSQFKDVVADTLYFTDFKDFKRTKKEPLFNRICRKIKRDYLYKNLKILPENLKVRLNRFNEFSINNIKLVDHPLEQNEMYDLDYDMFIVGSDVVWYQWRYGIRPIKLLDFKTRKKVKKVSYAASFGNDVIPSENVKELERCFSSFSDISVRENSSVEVMKRLGIPDAKHVMDPTMLLSKEEWENIEKPITSMIGLKKKYIFVYLLSAEKKDRVNIERISRNMGLDIVTVPFASGQLNDVDKKFGNYQVLDCSPEEWLWLIHNAAFVITDSFHGTAFSTRYHTPFLVTIRKEKFEINNRMKDFLHTIDQEDKFVDLNLIEDMSRITWEFDEIDKILDDKINFSQNYLNDIINNLCS